MLALFRTAFQKVRTFLLKVYIQVRTGRFAKSEEKNTHSIEHIPGTSGIVGTKPKPEPKPFGRGDIEKMLGTLRTMPQYFPRTLLIDTVSRSAYQRYESNQGLKQQFLAQYDGLVAQIEEACKMEDIQSAREFREEIRLLKYQVLDNRLQQKINVAIGKVAALEQDLEYGR